MTGMFVFWHLSAPVGAGLNEFFLVLQGRGEIRCEV